MSSCRKIFFVSNHGGRGAPMTMVVHHGYGGIHMAVMFLSPKAYGYAETLKDALDWWLAVADRLETKSIGGVK